MVLLVCSQLLELGLLCRADCCVGSEATCVVVPVVVVVVVMGDVGVVGTEWSPTAMMMSVSVSMPVMSFCCRLMYAVCDAIVKEKREEGKELDGKECRA